MNVGWVFAAVFAVCAAAGWIEAIRIHRLDDRRSAECDRAATGREIALCERDEALARIAELGAQQRVDANAFTARLLRTEHDYSAQIADRDEEIARLKQQLADVAYEVKTPRRPRGKLPKVEIEGNRA